LKAGEDSYITISDIALSVDTLEEVVLSLDYLFAAVEQLDEVEEFRGGEM
jgi:hypothetical protein